MSLPTQLGFWQEKVIADCHHKLAELYSQDPKTFSFEKRVIVTYWERYEGLASVLGDKFIPFVDWFYRATSPETITRCLRALKEDGTIKLSPKAIERRKKREQVWRNYWAQTKPLEESGDQS